MNLDDYKVWITGIVTRAVVAEDLLNQAISRLITGNLKNQAVIREAMLSRLSGTALCDILKRLLENANAPRTVVAELPSGLKELFTLRHQLAHNVPEFDQDPDHLKLFGYKNGREEVVALPLSHIRGSTVR